MKRSVLAWCLFLLFLTACSACGVPYVAKPAPMPQLEVMPWSHTERGVAVGTDPYVQVGRLKQIFGHDLAIYEIIPLQILVKNMGGRRLWLQRSAIHLERPDGLEIAPLRATAVAKMALPPAPYTPGEVVISTLLNMPVLVVLNEVTAGSSETLSRIAGKADQLPNPDGLTDYWRKELKDAILDSGESVQGFVYYPWPRTAPVFEEATLVMPLIELEGATRLVIRLRLRGLQIRRPAVEAEEE
jgi:hypothetical protein